MSRRGRIERKHHGQHERAPAGDTRRKPTSPAGPAPAPRGRASRLHGRSPLDWRPCSCDCVDCRQACLNSPGWFRPDQLDSLATHLGLDVEVVFRKYLAIGTTLMPDGSRRHGVMPHKLRDHKQPGRIWSLRELARPGRCIFFDRGKCRIYPVRPFECSRMLHSRTDQAQRLRQAIVAEWTPDRLKRYLAWAAEGRPRRRARLHDQ